MKFIHTADTHLGYEVSRVSHSDPEGRRRRAEWVLQNYRSVVDHALEVNTDLFIHSGDLFNKAYAPRNQLDELAAPLIRLAKHGVAVVVLPGNHEKSEFPFDLFHGAPRLTVFDEPRTVCLRLNGYSVAVAGFPFIREHSRRSFFEALKETGYDRVRADVKFLAVHQAFDGACVGPVEFTFRTTRSDTVSRAEVPTDLDYIAAGHIHRYQALPHPKKPDLLFVYSGSTQRMSFAEMNEPKGFIEGELTDQGITTRFRTLPAWDMEIVSVEACGRSAHEIEESVREQFWRFNDNLVVRFQVCGCDRIKDYPQLDAKALRADAPSCLEFQIVYKTKRRWVDR